MMMAATRASSPQAQSEILEQRVGGSRRVLAALLAPNVILIGRRLLTAVPVLLGVSLLTFAVLNLLPGSAAQQLLGAEATPAQIARLNAELNLDGTPVERYWDWFSGVVTGDLGSSLASGQPVATILAERLPVTLELVGYAFFLSVGLAVVVALLAAYKPNGFVDRLSIVLSMASLSMPSYVLALLLVLVFAVNLSVFPSMGFTPLGESLSGSVHSLTLPAVAIAFPLFGFYARFLRGDLLEQMHGEGYVVTALAKGLGRWQVLVGHALRNSSFGLLTIVGVNFGTLIGGTVVVEQIFALPGIGELLLQAINTRDVTVIQAVVLVLGATTVVVNLCIDILYAILDPRILYGRQ